MRDLAIRTASAVVLAVPVLIVVWIGSPWFEGLIIAGCLVLIREWWRLCAGAAIAWPAIGVAYIALAGGALIYLRSGGETGRDALFWLLSVVWASDIGAFAAGRLIGGPRLAPRISPNKTWAGVAGGLLAAAAAGGTAIFVLGGGPAWLATALGAGIGAVAQAGDLAESALKRRFGVKDAGGWIPGHGGLLDRVDGLMIAAVVAALIAAAAGGSMAPWM